MARRDSIGRDSVETMEIKVKRIAKKDTYTIGKMYIDGEWVCDTLEDSVRPVKIKHETAIPAGRYKVAMTVKSPKYSNFAKYKWAQKWDGKLPRLLDVPGYEGILMHVGNSNADTSGCLLVGKNKVVGKLVESTKTFTALMDKYLVPARDRREEIWIEIE